MKVFTSQGIEKEDNADVLVELNAVNNVLNNSKSLQEMAARNMQIMNLHLAIMNDQFIEESP